MRFVLIALVLALAACSPSEPEVHFEIRDRQVVLVNAGDREFEWTGPDPAFRHAIVETLTERGWVAVTPYRPPKRYCGNWDYDPNSLQPGQERYLHLVLDADGVPATLRIRLLFGELVGEPFRGYLPASVAEALTLRRMEPHAYAQAVEDIVRSERRLHELPPSVERSLLLTLPVEPILLKSARAALLEDPSHPWFDPFVHAVGRHTSAHEHETIEAELERRALRDG